jgi:hypothetical protein
MNTRVLVLACLGVIASLSQSAYSDEVAGVFVGTVDAGPAVITEIIDRSTFSVSG